MALTPAYFRKPRAKAKVFKRNTEVGVVERYVRGPTQRADATRRSDSGQRRTVAPPLVNAPQLHSFEPCGPRTAVATCSRQLRPRTAARSSWRSRHRRRFTLHTDGASGFR